MPRPALLLLCFVLLVGLGLRLGRFSEERVGPLALAPLGDEGTYDRWGLRLAQGRDPAAVPYMAPLQAYHLAAWHLALPGAPARARDMARLVGVLLGLGSILLTFALGRLAGGDRLGVLAAASVALHRPLIYYEPTLLRDGPATFFTLLAAWLLTRTLQSQRAGKRAALALALGLSLGVGALVRENLLLLGGLTVVGLLLACSLRRAERARHGLTALLVGLGMLAPLGPTLISNARLEGAISPLPTWNGGCVFYLHNRVGNLSSGYQAPPFVKSGNPEREAEAFALEAQRRSGRPLTPHQVSSFWLREGIRDVLREPGLYALKLGKRVLNFLRTAEIPQARDLPFDARSSAILSLPSPGFAFMAAFGLLGLLASRRSHAAWVAGLTVLALAATTLPVAFVTRYRLPAVPLVSILALLGLREATFGLRRLVLLGSASWAPDLSLLATTLSKRERDARLVCGAALALGLGFALHIWPARSDAVANHRNRGVALCTLGRWEEARAELEAIPAPDAVALEMLGEASLRTGRPQQACAAYEAAVAKAPDQARLWAGLALAASQARETERARAAIAEALRLDPGNAAYAELRRRLRDP